MPVDFSIETLLILGLFVFFAGIIDSISGGGGLISVPAYITSGLKLDFVLGTNKLSSTIGAFLAAIKYFKELHFKKSYLITLVLTSVAGSSLGAMFISSLPAAAIKYILIVLLPAAIYITVSKKILKLMDFSGRWSDKNIILKSVSIAFFISFYDGLLGPGASVFFAMAFTFFLRL